MSKKKIVERIKFLESEVARLESVVADYESILPDDGESDSYPLKKSFLTGLFGSVNEVITKALPYVALAAIAFFAVRYISSFDFKIGPDIIPKPNVVTDYDKLPDILK